MMNSEALIKCLMIIAFFLLFVEITALISLQVTAVYFFGGATIIFALLAMMVALLTD